VSSALVSVLGPTGLGRLDAGDTTFTFLADIGFALVMFVAGSRVPVRDRNLRAGLRTGALRAVAVGVPATALGVVIAYAFGTGHAAMYAVLTASSSAALVLPTVDSLHLGGPHVLRMLSQVAIADTASIVALPLAIDPKHAGRAALGALAVTGCAVALYFGLRYIESTGLRRRVHHVSEDASSPSSCGQPDHPVRTGSPGGAHGVSIMLAGFSFGLAVAAVGEPRRLARQLFAVTDASFAPMFLRLARCVTEPA
jgi:Kef-type K+ transport system membrane component KefB